MKDIAEQHPIPEPCPVCNGEGSIPNSEPETRFVRGQPLVIYNRPCSACDGTGVKPK